ncbi:MAG: DUF4160 domain-containing protein [Nostoc sp.]|uniref:DUF4160 domain-containing protein n=1 Tax=Nostoc sp. TaxID=1180 RepID=UPI002FFCD21D
MCAIASNKNSSPSASYTISKSGNEKMPEISRFFGIIITMYYNDHPPHFHVRYNNQKARTYALTINIKYVRGQKPYFS